MSQMTFGDADYAGKRKKTQRVHLMQNWFGLSDPPMEAALYEITPMRGFAGLSLTNPIPDETIIAAPSSTKNADRELPRVGQEHGACDHAVRAVEFMDGTTAVVGDDGIAASAAVEEARSRSETGSRDPETALQFDRKRNPTAC